LLNKKGIAKQIACMRNQNVLWFCMKFVLNNDEGMEKEND